MASAIYPERKGHLDEQIEKKICQGIRCTRAHFPNGFIIAKGNILEGIKAKE